jgi:hypothetical protein
MSVPTAICGIRWDQNPRVLPGNLSRFGRNGAAETVRVGAAALPTCSCGNGFARGIVGRKGEKHGGGVVQYAWLVGFELCSAK